MIPNALDEPTKRTTGTMRPTSLPSTGMASSSSDSPAGPENTPLGIAAVDRRHESYLAAVRIRDAKSMAAVGFARDAAGAGALGWTASRRSRLADLAHNPRSRRFPRSGRLVPR